MFQNILIDFMHVLFQDTWTQISSEHIKLYIVSFYSACTSMCTIIKLAQDKFYVRAIILNHIMLHYMSDSSLLIERQVEICDLIERQQTVITCQSRETPRTWSTRIVQYGEITEKPKGKNVHCVVLGVHTFTLFL